MIGLMSGFSGYGRIKAVGLELEGGWPENTPIKYDGRLTNAGGVIVRDGSVRINEGYDVARKAQVTRPMCYQGEVTTNHPLKPMTDLTQVENFLTTYYPRFINSTCGFHIHMSTVKRWGYNRLLTPDYTGDTDREGAIFKALREWATGKLPEDHAIWPRLRGENQHCQRRFCADEQAKSVDKSYSRSVPYARYTAVAFHWNRTGATGDPMRTVEVRLLPMFESVDLALEAVKVVLSTTNDFIAAQAKKKEPAVTIKVPKDAGSNVTRRRIRL